MDTPVFELEQQLYAQDYDMNALRKEWMDISSEKDWRISEEGWRRWLTRTKSTGKGPKRPIEKLPAKERHVPPEFVEWWKTHHDAWYDKEKDIIEGPPAKVAWIVQSYRTEYAKLEGE
ncbi:MAG: hypothetical protein ABI615_03815 [Chthoniobacterales bacterium]